MRKGCLYGVIGVLGLCVVGCALGYLVALPRLQDNLRAPLEEVVGTQIAREIAPIPNVRPVPGTVEIQQDDLNEGLRAEIDGTEGLDDVSVTLAPSGFELRFTASDSDVAYTGNVSAENGQLEVIDMEGDGLLTTFFPASEVEEALENVVNDYLAANDLRLTQAELGDGTLTLTTEAA